MFRLRPTRIRGLSFYRSHGGHLPTHEGLLASDSGVRPAGVGLAPGGSVAISSGDGLDAIVHARSRFQSVDDPDLFALYAVHDLGLAPPSQAGGASHHTLMVAREFRRVPLGASALALIVFRARGGHAATAIAAVAHWAERAVSLSEPAYLLVAHSLEDPRLIALLTGVHECDALAGSRGSAFSVDSLLTEAGVLFTSDPEWYAYCAPDLADSALMVSPSAV